jgi:hypothetical protein
MTPTKTEIKVANRIIKILEKAGFTPDEMINVIDLARKKYNEMNDKTTCCICKPNDTTGWTTAKCCNICGKPLKGEWCCS